MFVQWYGLDLWRKHGRYRGRMRWHDLFDDLEAQLMRADREAFDDEVRERAEAEKAAVTFGAILAASEGERLRLTLVDGSRVEGSVTDCAAQWVHLTDGPREWLVPAAAIAAVDGAARGAPDPGMVVSRLTLGHALRALAEGGGEVLVVAQGLQVRGAISAVGADFVTVAGARTLRMGAILTVSPAY